MAAMEGTLTAESNPGAGSTFPAAVPRVIPRSLVVNDQEMSRQVMRVQLESIGVQVPEVSNGREALELLQREELPHLIVADILMPGMNGVQMLKKNQG